MGLPYLENHIAILSLKAVTAVQTRGTFSVLFGAKDTSGTGISFDEGDTPATRWQGHCGVRGKEEG